MPTATCRRRDNRGGDPTRAPMRPLRLVRPAPRYPGSIENRQPHTSHENFGPFVSLCRRIIQALTMPSELVLDTPPSETAR